MRAADTHACRKIPRRFDNWSCVVAARVRFLTATTTAVVSCWMEVVRAASMSVAMLVPIDDGPFHRLKLSSLSLHFQVLTFARQLLSLLGDFLPFKVKDLQLLVFQL